MTGTFSGLTWDHPRGVNALIAGAKRFNHLISWDVHSLEGFETAPIADICSAYDLVVLDHPHLGEALKHGCLKPLDEVFDVAFLAGVSKQTLGPSFESYELSGQQWALPLDSATQVMATRADLTGGAPLTTYQDVIEYAKASGSMALCLGGPHACLSFMSISSAIDPTIDMRNNGAWIAQDVASEAYEVLLELHAHSPDFTIGFNPISMLEYMSSEDRISVCPLIYGYVNYAASSNKKPLSFVDAPCAASGLPGSIIGGTGIAISSRCEPTTELREHIEWLMSKEVQRDFIPMHDGQPSHSSAWLKQSLNKLFSDFYANTSRTLEYGSIRPRHDGYIAFQSQASNYIRESLSDKLPAKTVTSLLYEQFQKSVGK